MLGDVFLQNFYTAFDAEASSPRVGIALEINSKGVIKDSDVPSKFIKFLKVFVVLAAVAAFIVGFVYLCLKKRK